MNQKDRFYFDICRELNEGIREAEIEHRMPGSITDGRAHVVLACMDERNTLTEEALGVYPYEVRRIATAGGMISAKNFQRLMHVDDKPLTAYLVTHEVIGRPELGCAAFKNDIVAQERYFDALKADLVHLMPAAFLHVVSMDTSTGALRPISLDPRDERFSLFVQRGGQTRPRCGDENHAGFGIYVGEAYRAWHIKRNTFFHISACSPSLLHDLEIALSVIQHHSDVDLSDKPIILHVDVPASWNGYPADCAERMQTALTEFLTKPEVAALTANGNLRVIQSTTNLDTWQGELVTTSS